ncbi:MAG: cell division protein FtsX [Prochlorothrix sp.]
MLLSCYRLPIVAMKNRLTYILQETGRSLQRGGWMNGAAVSTITVLLLLLGLSLQVGWQLDRLVGQFGNQLEINLFLSPGVAGESLLSYVQPLAGVESVTVITQDQAWERLRTELDLPDLAMIEAQFQGNPLVDELRVKAKSPEVVPDLVPQLAALGGGGVGAVSPGFGGAAGAGEPGAAGTGARDGVGADVNGAGSDYNDDSPSDFGPAAGN